MKVLVLQDKGFSLIELLIVLIVIGIAMAVGMQWMGASVDDYRRIKTDREMEMLASAIVGNPELTSSDRRCDFGYIGDIGAFPLNLDGLYQNPGGFSTWNGPYLPPGFVQDTIGFKIDEWGQTYAYTGGITITSNGSGSAISKKIAEASSDYLINTTYGIIQDANDSLPGTTYRDSIDIIVTLPDGSGGMLSKMYGPDSAGIFRLDSLTAGIHPLDIIYTPNNDTLSRFVAIMPRNKGDTITYKFGSALFISGGSGPGNVVYENFTEAKLPANGNAITVSTPPGTAAGDLLIAAVVTDGNRSASLAPPGGEGWTVFSITQQNGSVTFGVWWKLADASEPPSHQFTWSGTSEQSYAWIMRFTGHDAVDPINNWGADGGTSSTPTCPTISTTSDNAMILRLGGFQDDNINIDSPGLAGHTAITMDESNSGSGTCSGGAGYNVQATAGLSGTANFALTAPSRWRTMTIAITPG